MLNADQRPQLEERINALILLAPELKDELVKILLYAEDEDFARIEQIIQKAEKKQQQLLEKMIRYDTTFTANLKQFTTSEYMQQQKKEEEASREEEEPESLLDQL